MKKLKEIKITFSFSQTRGTEKKVERTIFWRISADLCNHGEIFGHSFLKIFECEK